MIARNKQIDAIEKFITTRIDQRNSGILYLTGPPGTGKTMSIQHVLNTLKTTNKYKDVRKVDINCMRIQTAKSILAKICRDIGLEKQVTAKSTEADMISKITRKFSGRNSDTYLFVLDEIDHLPTSKNLNLIKTIFEWPKLQFSKLVLVGISNTLNLTSRMETLNSLLGTDTKAISKIIFKPYTASDIKSILIWYMENDENYQDAEMDPRALEMIAKKFSRENGDIRGALNACKSTLEDAVRSPPQLSIPNQTSTPKARATLGSTATSIRKRQKNTNFQDDVFPLNHQLVLFCVNQLITSTKQPSIDSIKCYSLFLKLAQRFSMSEDRTCFQYIMESLESQGLVRLKKTRTKKTVDCKIILLACESEIDAKIIRKELIQDAMKHIHVLNTQTFGINSRVNLTNNINN